MFSPVADQPALETRLARQDEVLCLKVQVLASCFAQAVAASSSAASEMRGLSPALVRWELVRLNTVAASPVAAWAGAAVTTPAPAITIRDRIRAGIRARISVLRTLGTVLTRPGEARVAPWGWREDEN